MNNVIDGQAEESNIPNFGDGNPNKGNSSELVERNKIQGTPFSVVTDNTQEKAKHFIVWGRYRLTKIYDTQEEALNSLIEEQYNVIPIMVAIMMEADDKLKREGLYEQNRHPIMKDIEEQEKIKAE